MRTLTKSWSVAAAVVLVIVYLCHVTADDAPARSRPPGMLFHLLTRNCIRYNARRQQSRAGVRDYKGRAKQATFGASNPTLGVASIVSPSTRIPHIVAREVSFRPRS